MTDSIEEALDELAVIRSSLLAQDTFRGYRSESVGCTAVLAFAGCFYQWRWPDANLRLESFLQLWIPIAFFSIAITFGEVVLRYWQSGPVLRRLTRSATTPMIPSLVAGVLLTAAIAKSSSEMAWMLPGLWSIVFGLGVSASSRFLPRPIQWVAIHYVVMGAVCVALGPDGTQIPFWSMGLTFGVGQLLGAILLSRTLECHT